jgi:hypothetical protein
MPVEDSPANFKARLSAEQRGQVDADLAAGMGLALYSDTRGTPRLVVSYGPRGADIVGLPPKGYGQADWELAAYVAPQRKTAAMKSPLASWEPVPQIKAPLRGQSHTEHPQVLMAGRTGPHPRGDGEYITPSAPRQSVEAPAPQRSLSEEEAWWQRRMT